jgi:hypothetical protein
VRGAIWLVRIPEATIARAVAAVYVLPSQMDRS